MKNGKFKINERIVWWKDDLIHREDGPAIEYEDGSKKWFLNGVEYTEEEFNQWLAKQELNKKFNSIFAPRHKEKKNKI